MLGQLFIGDRYKPEICLLVPHIALDINYSIALNTRLDTLNIMCELI